MLTLDLLGLSIYLFIYSDLSCRAIKTTTGLLKTGDVSPLTNQQSRRRRWHWRWRWRWLLPFVCFALLRLRLRFTLGGRSKCITTNVMTYGYDCAWLCLRLRYLRRHFAVRRFFKHSKFQVIRTHIRTET